MQKILTHKRYAKECKEKIDIWKTSQENKSLFKKFLDDYENGDVTGRVGSNIATTIERQTQFLRPCLEWINQKKFTLDNIKKFKSDLLGDKIEKASGGAYSLRVKKDMLSSFARFLDYTLKDDSPSKPLKIKIDMKKADIKFLSMEEINNLYKHCKNAKERYFIAMLFGSGTRAEEFQNIRFSDITMPKPGEEYVKLRIRNEYSKTEGRTISLYYNHTLEAVRDYLEERKGLDPEEPVFETAYDSMRVWINRFGKKVLKKIIGYHLFRHSCATWLANKMNRQQLCIYFGWKFSSPMPDVYIKRKGVGMEIVTEKFKATEFEELKRKMKKESFDKDMKLEELKNLILKKDQSIDDLIQKKFEQEYAKHTEKLTPDYFKNLKENPEELEKLRNKL